MTRFRKTLLLWALILFACSPTVSTPQAPPLKLPTDTPLPPLETNPTLEIPLDITTRGPTGPKFIVTVGTPHIDQGPNGEFPVTKQSSDTCGFSWATYPLESLSSVIDEAVKGLNPETSARASAFGEDCNYQDGSKKFLAIETDYYIDLPFTDLTDFEVFGNWIAQTMPIVASLPPEMVEGPQSGFVEYRFVKTENEFLIVRVPIQAYNNLAQGKTGEELFRMFYTE